MRAVAWDGGDDRLGWWLVAVGEEREEESWSGQLLGFGLIE